MNVTNQTAQNNMSEMKLHTFKAYLILMGITKKYQLQNKNSVNIHNPESLM